MQKSSSGFGQRLLRSSKLSLVNSKLDGKVDFDLCDPLRAGTLLSPLPFAAPERVAISAGGASSPWRW